MRIGQSRRIEIKKRALFPLPWNMGLGHFARTNEGKDSVRPSLRTYHRSASTTEGEDRGGGSSLDPPKFRPAGQCALSMYLETNSPEGHSMRWNASACASRLLLGLILVGSLLPVGGGCGGGSGPGTVVQSTAQHTKHTTDMKNFMEKQGPKAK
jgi:hypothetical protein